jgi:hypothetical protein
MGLLNFGFTGQAMFTMGLVETDYAGGIYPSMAYCLPLALRGSGTLETVKNERTL